MNHRFVRCLKCEFVPDGAVGESRNALGPDPERALTEARYPLDKKGERIQSRKREAHVVQTWVVNFANAFKQAQLALMDSLRTSRESAVREALGLVEDQDPIGLGSGSTVELLVDKMAEQGFLNRRFVVASRATQLKLMSYGVAAFDLYSNLRPELTFDGADKVDPSLNLIKGGGAALLAERLLAERTRSYIIVVDDQKLVPDVLMYPIPVEIEPISYQNLVYELRGMGLTFDVRIGSGKNGPLVTDNGNWVIDVQVGSSGIEAGELRDVLKRLTGVVDVGVFSGLATSVYVAGEGGVKVMHR